MSGKMCQSCRTRPAYGNHNFCSKTCSTAKKTCLCCLSNPVFEGSEYCSKTCVETCNQCGSRPKHSGSLYCSRACGKDAAAGVPRPDRTTSAPPPRIKSRKRASEDGKRSCILCGATPCFPGSNYCGMTCKEEAASGRRPGFGTKQGDDRRGGRERGIYPARNDDYPRRRGRNGDDDLPDRSALPGTCMNCKIRPSAPGHDFCSKDCKKEAAAKLSGPGNPRRRTMVDDVTQLLVDRAREMRRNAAARTIPPRRRQRPESPPSPEQSPSPPPSRSRRPGQSSPEWSASPPPHSD